MNGTGRSPAGTDSLGRIRGLDLTRALALLGMLIVNYELSLGAYGKGPGWLAALTGSLQGRAAATFVVLAGVGASLGAVRASASGEVVRRRRARWALVRRGALLFAGGCAFWTIWPADILHYYGVWLVLGASLLFARDGALVLMHGACVLGGALFVIFGEYFAHWKLLELTYTDLDTPSGFLRNLMFDGWHPVLPWFALYVYGMLLGRLDLRSGLIRKWLAGTALCVGALVLALESKLAPPESLSPGPWHLLRTSSFPPTPAFVEFGACVATVAIVLGIEVERRLPRLFRPVVETGQLALTHYVAQVFVGLGALEAAGRLGDQSLPFAVAAALTFFAASLAFSVLWLRSFRRGPLEALLRSV